MSETLDRLTTALADRYRVERELGAGGMATVYLAHDLKHDRRVALKVLRPELAAVIGAERFLAEIKTTANLQHPHILALFDSGSIDGTVFYVMPFIDGESLRDKLDRERQLPLDEALRTAREVADALEYAHRQGVIHRDIKPENILLQGGHALVADFGIALAASKVGGTRMTETGMSLGTPHYMSPEQAMGERELDARTDIYALGCVTYEMLAGEPPFTGPTAQSIVAKVVTEPAPSAQGKRATVPDAVDDAIRTALEKTPADRFRSAAAFAEALAVTGTTTGARTAARGRAAGGGRGSWLVTAAAVVGAAVLAFLAGRGSSAGSGSSFATFGRSTPVTWEQGLELTPALSPDGKQIAYTVGNGTRSKVFVRPVADGRPTPLTSDSGAVELFPRWSRDGTRILYVKDGLVFSAPAGGGPPRQEVPSRGGQVVSAAWSPDNSQIAYVVGDTLFLHQADGTSRLLALAEQMTLCTWGPQDLIACSAGNGLYLMPGIGFGNIAPSWIILVRVEDGGITTVTDSSSNNQSPQWSRDGRSLFFLSNKFGVADLYALPIAGDGTAGGSPERLTVGLNISTFSLSGDDSRLAYAVMTTTANVWSEPWTGGSPPAERRPTQVTFGQQTVEAFTLSHDGTWLFYDSDLAGNSDIYRMALATGVPERLTSDRTPEFAPSPSPDGRHVAFHSFRGDSRDIYVLPLDGGALEKITSTPAQEAQPNWSPDGASIVYFVLSGPPTTSIARRGAGGGWEIRERLAAGYWQRWSPDGRFLSFTSDLLGGELYVMPADSGAPRPLYDGQAPGAPVAETSRWSEDGRTIYFKSHDASGAASVWAIPAAGGTPQRLFDLGDDRLRSDRYGFQIANGLIYYTLTDRQSNIWLMELE